MAGVSSATKFFPTAQEGFTTATSGSVSSGAATVGLNSVSGYSNGEVVTLVIDPTDSAKKQVFTGVVDTSGVQITGVVWTEGTNQSHTSGATVVDYETATAWALQAKGLLVAHEQDGTHKSGATYTAPVLSGNVTGTYTLVSPTVSGTVTGAVIGSANLATSSGIPYRLGLSTKTTLNDVIPNAYTTYCTVTATTLNKEVEIAYGANIHDATSGATRTGHIRVQMDGATISGSDIIWQTQSSGVYGATPNMIISHTPAAGSHTYTLQVEADTASASALDQAYLRVMQLP